MTMLGPTSFKKAIEEAEKLSESLKLRLEALVVLIVHTLLMHELQDRTSEHEYVIAFFFPFAQLICTFLNRYEEVEVRKKLEEKERQEEKKRREEIKEKDAGRVSPKASSANKKDSKKVEISNNEYTVMVSV